MQPAKSEGCGASRGRCWHRVWDRQGPGCDSGRKEAAWLGWGTLEGALAEGLRPEAARGAGGWGRLPTALRCRAMAGPGCHVDSSSRPAQWPAPGPQAWWLGNCPSPGASLGSQRKGAASSSLTLLGHSGTQPAAAGSSLQGEGQEAQRAGCLPILLLRARSGGGFLQWPCPLGALPGWGGRPAADRRGVVP